MELYAYAEFDSIDNKDQYRLMDMSARSGNRDGAALRYAAERLLTRPEAIRPVIGELQLVEQPPVIADCVAHVDPLSHGKVVQFPSMTPAATRTSAPSSSRSLTMRTGG